MEHTPDIDVIITLNVEDQLGIASQNATAQPWKAKLIGVPRRAGGRTGFLLTCFWLGEPDF